MDEPSSGVFLIKESQLSASPADMPWASETSIPSLSSYKPILYSFLELPQATMVVEPYLRRHLAGELSIRPRIPLLVWFGAVHAEINEHRDATSCPELA
jgi:hypothetical protein